MGQIQSNFGVITGFPIFDTVDQLISISARPRDLAISRSQQLSAEQISITQLTSLLVSFQGAVNNLADASVFDAKSVTSSNETLLTASASTDGTPANGGYLFTPVRRAQAQHFLSNSIVDKDQTFGAGTFTLQSGGFVDRGVDLARLNDGGGVSRGEICITDGSGASAVIDLRFALTVDDVIKTINSETAVNVTTSTDGDHLRLSDNTGQTSSNLHVEDVNGGSTAADLGLAGIDLDLTVATEADGQDVLRLYDGLSLTELNDGNGLSVNNGVEDLQIKFRDGSNLDIDITTEATLGQLVDTLNNADTSRLSAQITADGAHVELTDLTSGGQTFSVESWFGGTLGEDLGVAGSDDNSDGVITSERLRAGLKDVLLRSLQGGSGFGDLGSITLKDRSGSNTAVDLSSAETLQDLISSINTATGAAGVAITARVNDARNGILLEDASGGTGNLTVTNADALGLTVDAAQDSINGGTLDLQIVSESTLLSSLNGGEGVELGSFIITDSSGENAAIKLDDEDEPITTLGGLIDAITAKDIEVDARINDSGDGIVLIDRAGGSADLSVREVNGDSAADLGLLGTATEQEVGGETVNAINGSSRTTIEIGAEDTLDDLVKKINDAAAGTSASLVFDGSGHRLSLVSSTSGRAGELLVDASGTGLSLQQISQAQDALLALGPPETAGSSILISSSSNTFSSVVDGVDITLVAPADEAVTIDVSTSEKSLVDAVDGFIKAYNAIVDNIDSATFFDEVANTTGILFGSTEVLRVETELSNLATSGFFGLGEFQSLEQVGIEFNDSEKLSLDRDKLTAALKDNPEALKTFFTKEEETLDPTRGVVQEFDALIDSLAGKDNSLLSNRSDSLSDKIDGTNDRIEFLNLRLETERELLLNQFFQMESIIAQLQNSLSALNSLTAISPLTSSRSR